jgi:hypothetical protein
MTSTYSSRPLRRSMWLPTASRRPRHAGVTAGVMSGVAILVLVLWGLLRPGPAASVLLLVVGLAALLAVAVLARRSPSTSEPATLALLEHIDDLFSEHVAGPAGPRAGRPSIVAPALSARLAEVPAALAADRVTFRGAESLHEHTRARVARCV